MKKIITNSSRKIAGTNKYMSWLICMLLFLLAGMQSATAQTQAFSQRQATSKGTVYKIPQALIAGTKYTVNKSVDSKISFDAKTPNFLALTIVDNNNKPVRSVMATNEGTDAANATKRTFDFTDVPAGTYYATIAEKSTTYFKIIVQ